MALQEDFIQNLIQQNISVNVYLVSGIKLLGNIKEQDTYCIMLSQPNGKDQLIYKHAVSTIVPV